MPLTERKCMADNEADHTRRGVVQAAGVGTALALAGCLGIDDADEESSPDNNETDTANNAGQADKANDQDGTDEPASPDTLEQRAREFLELADAGEFESAYELVSDGFAEQLSQNEISQFWAQEIAIYGDIEQFLSVEYRREREDGVVTVTVQADLTDRMVEFQYGFSNGEIVEWLATPISEWTQPDYVDPAALSESEITLSAPGDCELGATLSVPTSGDSLPGVVLVHGSGDQDRDQTVGANKTFRELAQGLASQGIAVLRYDQRTVACDVDRTAATLDDIVTDDAVAAVDRLRSVEQVSEVFVAGHSLGGRVAPRVAARADTAGLVMLAPLAEPVHEAIVRQTRHRLTLDGGLSERDEQTLAETKTLAERLRTLDIGAEETLKLGGGRGRPFWRTLQEYDHVGTAARLNVPTLLIQGGRDYLVTTEDDLPVWREAIGDEPQTEIVIFEELNHRFQPGEEPSRPQEWEKPENPVDKRVIDRIVEFLPSE